MSAIPLIICERTGRWATLLRQALDERDYRLIETRGLADFRQHLDVDRPALVALELTADNVEPVFMQLLRSQRDFPRAAVVVLTERSLAQYEAPLREAGAVHFTDSPRRLCEVAELARRFRANYPQDNNTAASPTEQILANLPWSAG